MRQGQQNRRGRGRGGNGANNNRKAQNPLSRSYESSGPDVKIRGTAAQIAEKYTTLARDASSSGDTIMAENYLQHAEHYNRIIMAAQAQNVQPTLHNGSEAAHAMNGAHRNSRDFNGASRDQPQPHIGAHPAEDAQPAVQQLKTQPQQPELTAEPAKAEQAKEQEQPVEETPPPAPAKRTRKSKEAAKDNSETEAENGRRRRRRYPGSNGSGRTAASEGEGNGDGEASAQVTEDQTTDEATA